MDDPLNTPEVPASEQAQESANSAERIALSRQITEKVSEVVIPRTVNAHGEPSEASNPAVADQHAGGEQTAELAFSDELAFAGALATVLPDVPDDDAASRRRSFRHNLFLLLALTLAAFTLTTWILIRVDSPFGIFSTGPQEIVRAQLRALDRGELRPAYDMFSARYRGQVSFDVWHQLIVTHRRMFHAEVLGSKVPANAGPGITLEIYLHGADDKDYRARFTLIRTGGRWWIDDVHWTEEPDRHDVSRT